MPYILLFTIFIISQYNNVWYFSDKMVLKRPVFSQDIMSRLRPLNACDNYHGIFSVLHDWFIVFGCIIVNNWLMKYNFYLGLLFYIVSLLAIAGRMRGLSSLLHESTHRALAKWKLLNDILGSVLSGWCVLQSWTGYHYQHVVLHHPHLGDADKDPDYKQFLQTGLYDEGTTRADVIDYLTNIPSPRSTVLYVQYLIKDRIFPKSEKGFETVLRISFWAAVVIALYETGNMKNFLIYWVIPMLTTANWIGNIAEILEHFPLLRYKGADELHSSRNKFCGTIGDFLFNPHGDEYHLLHHLFGRIPHWNYKKAHDILMEDENYRSVNQCKIGLVPQLQDMLSHFD